MSGRRLAGAVRRVRDECRHGVTVAAGRVPYVGWVGHDNAGDEAMYTAHRELLAPVRLGHLGSLASRPVAEVVRPRRDRPVLLGGGTLVGNGYFRRMLEPMLHVQGRPSVLSVGVEDPAFGVGARSQTPAELARWWPLLRAFPTVRVRGPRSAEVLADLGIEATVVGDPALGLAPPGLSPDPVPGRLVVNTGTTDGSWGQDPGRLSGDLADFVRSRLDEGWTVELAVIWPADLPAARRVAEGAGGRARVVEAWSVPTLMRLLASADVVVGLKLHAVVLAAAVGTPAVALEYRPKCRDFQQSIGRERWVLRTDSDLGELGPMVDELAAARSAHAAEITAAVEVLRARLADAAVQVRAELTS